MFDKDIKEERCLACKYFRLVDEIEGLCKEDKGLKPDYPKMKLGESCPKWTDAGQQYYIRLGWLKNRNTESSTK